MALEKCHNVVYLKRCTVVYTCNMVGCTICTYNLYIFVHICQQKYMFNLAHMHSFICRCTPVGFLSTYEGVQMHQIVVVVDVNNLKNGRKPVKLQRESPAGCAGEGKQSKGN